MKGAIFDKNEFIKRAAIAEYENYVNDVMSASYGQDLEVIHQCGEKETLLTEDRNDTEADDDDAYGANTNGITIYRDKAETTFSLIIKKVALNLKELRICSGYAMLGIRIEYELSMARYCIAIDAVSYFPLLRL